MAEHKNGELDAYWMKLALEEARLGLGATSPNPPVGAVIVKDGLFLAKGHHERAGEPHAEVMAIRASAAAGSDPRGATIYVTLEPCSTTGRTPPCVEAIREAGISRVVIGAVDPNPDHAGRGIEILREAGIEAESGVLEAECANLIRFFAKHIQTGRPYVIAKTGMTLDGRITPPEGGSQWITSEESRMDVQRLRSEVDAILIGGETLRRDNPRLTLRGEFAGRSRPQPLRIVVTQNGQLPKESLVFTDEHLDRTRVFHVEHPEAEFAEIPTIEPRNAEIITNPARDLDHVLLQLGESGVTSVLLECGGRLMGHAFEQQIVDEIQFYVAPLIGGGNRRAVEGEDFRCELVDPKWEAVGSDLRVTAAIRYD
ncbi:MAG: diaminohydroxyphosphoribosylaminopyrimidine deaminase [Verrucomicrobiales bacterium]|jgi:diaminohydroxyphosphoribosylaminopyrimidine deaminase/5-amino-6-(5-phosphoribosylamino)uracil reductase